MSHPDSEKWDAIYKTSNHGQHHPARVLSDHTYLLPKTGRALDLACGTGMNAILLAQHGLETCAWDISKQAIEKLDQAAIKLKINIMTEVRDIVSFPPDKKSFDVIVVSHFLDRQLMPKIIEAITGNGLLFYQTFIRDRIDDSGPSNPDYRLEKNELLTLCNTLNIVYYQEDGLVGDHQQGLRNEAMLIGQCYK